MVENCNLAQLKSYLAKPIASRTPKHSENKKAREVTNS